MVASRQQVIVEALARNGLYFYSGVYRKEWRSERYRERHQAVSRRFTSAGFNAQS